VRAGKFFKFTGPDGHCSKCFEFYGPGRRVPLFSTGFNILILSAVGEEKFLVLFQFLTAVVRRKRSRSGLVPFTLDLHLEQTSGPRLNLFPPFHSPPNT
jgi:hypothetical protein